MSRAVSDPVDDLALADLRRVVAALAAQVGTLQEAVDRLTSRNAALEAENVALKDEIARLKGLPPRPKFKVKPSGMEQATSKPASKNGRKRGRGSARHAGKDGFVTQLGDNRFTVFRTAMSKSRRAFLSLLQAGRTDYVVNDTALSKMRTMNMAATQIASLANHAQTRFADEVAWRGHLQMLGFDTLKITPDPVKVATEAALWGAICDQGLLQDTVIVSDGAGQFRVGDHASCWVHAERLVYKLQPLCDAHRRAVDLKRSLIWWFYADLKASQREPDPRRARMLRAPFDRIFTKTTGYAILDRQLTRLHRLKPDLLRVLDRPEIPLHTNGWENDIRTLVTKRKISGGTVSEHGKTARDTMLGLLKTCTKLGVSYYRLLGDRLGVPGAVQVAPLPDLVRLAKA